MTYNHYCNIESNVDVEVESMAQVGLVGYGDQSKMLLQHKLINGYDGFGGVHDNLHWNLKEGFTYFTLNNKLIIEETKTRK